MGEHKWEESSEYFLKKISNVLGDQEFGFDVFVLMKSEKLKRFLFYEDKMKSEPSFKNKLQETIVETVKKDYLVEKEQYKFVDDIADDQHKIYILPQNTEYKPFECLKEVDGTEKTFEVNDYDEADAIMFRFRREDDIIWAYQKVNPVLIPNKKRNNFLLRAQGQSKDIFTEMTDKIFTITRKVNILIVNDCILTREIGLMERHYKFEGYIRMRAVEVVNKISKVGIIENIEKMRDYIQRPQKKYANKMMRISRYNVVKEKPEELIEKLEQIPRWKGVFKISGNKIKLDTYKDVENIIDLFDERYTKSLITNDEFDTDVKKIV